MSTTTLDLRVASFDQLELSPGASQYDPYFDSRYAVLAEVIHQLSAGQKDFKVLELGGQVSALRHYLPNFDITIADTALSPDTENYVQLTNKKLPFLSGSFDVVVCCDTVEHIPRPDRDDFVNEMLRVGLRFCVIGGPFDSKANQLAEDLLRSFYASLTGQRHRWLEEHNTLGLPTRDWLDAILETTGLHYTRFDHSDTLLWSWLLMAYLTASASSSQGEYQKLAAEYLRQVSIHDFTPGGYRTFYITARNGRIKVVLPKPQPNLTQQYAKEVAGGVGRMIKKLATSV